ncbi:hypothetical protein MNBD_UNCLBAC01-1941 [hydrothermal vent metagenome]|uniref:Glycosyltransferase n=1 Tax=hydrothermal vent metagenome TaxID=652676 RepID=A0A3B1D5R2_9ZZZZ
MNILVCSIDYKPKDGGIAEFMFHVCQYFSKKHNVTIVAPKIDGCEKFDSHNFSMKTYRLKNIRPLVWFSLKSIILNFFEFYKGIMEIIKMYENMLNIVEQNNVEKIIVFQWNLYGFMAYLINRKKKIPFYIVAHGLEIIKNKKRGFFLRNFFQRSVQKMVFSKSVGIFTNSAYTKNIVLENVSKKLQVHVTYCGVDYNDFFPKEKKYDLIGNQYRDYKIIFTLSRLVERKGIDNALCAFKKYMAVNPEKNVVYFIGGKGLDEKRLKKLVHTLELSNHVVFLGFIPDELKNEYYNLSDVFLMPCREEKDGDIEGFGIVYLEANACGVPVIAGASGGIPCAVKDEVNGLLVNPLCKKDIFLKLQKILNNQKYAEFLGEKGRQYGKKNFSWEKVTNRFFEIIE